jgi:hypothetical protein
MSKPCVGNWFGIWNQSDKVETRLGQWGRGEDWVMTKSKELLVEKGDYSLVRRGAERKKLF